MYVVRVKIHYSIHYTRASCQLIVGYVYMTKHLRMYYSSVKHACMLRVHTCTCITDEIMNSCTCNNILGEIYN